MFALRATKLCGHRIGRDCHLKNFSLRLTRCFKVLLQGRLVSYSGCRSSINTLIWLKYNFNYKKYFNVRYDAVDRILYIDSKVGDFTSFISTATGFGNVSLKAGKPVLNTVYGKIDVDRIIVSGKEMKV